MRTRDGTPERLAPTGPDALPAHARAHCETYPRTPPLAKCLDIQRVPDSGPSRAPAPYWGSGGQEARNRVRGSGRATLWLAPVTVARGGDTGCATA